LLCNSLIGDVVACHALHGFICLFHPAPRMHMCKHLHSFNPPPPPHPHPRQCIVLQLLLLSSIKEACLSRDLLGALMALAAGPLSRAEKMSDEDHQVCVGVVRGGGGVIASWR
jgi:hypothetical protein